MTANQVAQWLGIVVAIAGTTQNCEATRAVDARVAATIRTFGDLHVAQDFEIRQARRTTQ